MNTEPCPCPCHAHGEDFAHQLLELADEAWMEILKEKIKENIRQKGGEQLTQLANLVSERNHKRWNHKLADQHHEREFECRLKDIMGGQSCKK